MDGSFRNLLPKEIVYIPVGSYRLIFLIGIMTLFVAFSASDNGYCSSNALTSVSKQDSLNCLEYWTNRYQSLLGAIIAFVGAMFAFSAVRIQISQTERLAEIARQRKEQATTAVAPFALSQTVEYSKDCMNSIVEARDQVLAHITHPPFSVPQFPKEVINLMRDYVEFGDERHTKAASLLLHAIQIQQARIGGLKEKISTAGPGLYTDSELEDAMFDALDLHAQAGALFAPIRKDYKFRSFSIDNMYNDLRVRGIELSEWPRLKFKIEAFARSQSSHSP